MLDISTCIICTWQSFIFIILQRHKEKIIELKFKKYVQQVLNVGCSYRNISLFIQPCRSYPPERILAILRACVLYTKECRTYLSRLIKYACTVLKVPRK